MFASPTAARQVEISVTFQVLAETKVGEIIRIIGSSESLGSWEEGSGVELTTTPELYPAWTATVCFKAASRRSIIEAEYKYVRECPRGGLHWETMPNRQIRLQLGYDSPSSGEGTWLVCDPGLDHARTKEVTFLPVCRAARMEPFEDSYHVMGDKLGFGAFGTVWRCWRVHSKAPQGHSLAAKQLEKSKMTQRDVWCLFGSEKSEGEINLHLAQKHPHIVQLLDVFDEAFNVTLVMEACDGGDLFNYVVSHTKSSGVGVLEQAATVVMGQLLSALDYLHCQLIVHRDVKCENVVLRHRHLDLERNTCKLCDFGLAARLPPGGMLQEPVGSLDYAAPELVQKAPCYGTPSDLWAAGVMLYMMLSGEAPFLADTDNKVLQKIRNCEYSLEGSVWSQVTNDTKSYLSGLLTLEQDQRQEIAATIRQLTLPSGFCIPVTFKVQAPTQPGETLRVVGSAEELGGWDAGSGALLATRPGLYPEWTATVYFKLACRQSVLDLEYKFLRDGCLHGRGFSWETGPNRRVTLELGYESWIGEQHKRSVSNPELAQPATSTSE
eukprot:CAMPEP_0197658420 /NCGR_PEP_ID=MMETSP1338-20131121/45227_1 /TAXON_ID=43686 ORGANISM="Pelagodinium beii, Strain RCC1491" /NCGR_SAMPLE_ID=MMETSP1338 /ASSEMBLY_ACC=CAM_ASM_000754 /LENGTH=551 /DNA_ID=CAMNT_0043235005 /DNA_START=69 /DNA_END=1721 /DNA_ORIENTATION=+